MYAVVLSNEDVVVWSGEVETPDRWLDMIKPSKIDFFSEPLDFPITTDNIIRCELNILESEARGYLVYYYPKI